MEGQRGCVLRNWQLLSTVNFVSLTAGRLRFNDDEPRGKLREQL